MDKIPVEGNPGLIFTLGMMFIFLSSLPQVRCFFVLAIPPGILIGMVLYLIHRRPVKISHLKLD